MQTLSYGRFARSNLVRIALLIALLAPVVLHAEHTPAAVAPAPGFGAIGKATGNAAILNTYDAIFVEASAKFAIPANLIKAVAWVEDGWHGTSPSGAVGIMQIMPIYWGDIAWREGYDIYSTRGNILMGTYILRLNLNTYGSYQWAVRAYLGFGVDSVTGISDGRYWEMVYARWQELNAAPKTKLIANPNERANPDIRGADPFRARDGQLGTSWYVRNTPGSAILQVDLGRTIKLSSIWWIFRIGGGADRFAVRASLDGHTWTTIGRFGNAPVLAWQMVATDQKARYVRLHFANPNEDPVVGYVAELKVYGTGVATQALASTRTPTVTPTKTRTPSPTVERTPSTPPADCSLSPNTAAHYSKLTVRCTGLQPDERVELRWDAEDAPSIADFTANESGEGSGSFRVPETPGGPHTLWVVGETTSPSELDVTVKPRASLNPLSGASGRTVKVTLRGFQAGEVVAIRWYDTASSSTTVARNLVASELGTVVLNAVVPDADPGEHKIDGRGALGSRATILFTVTGAASASARTSSATEPAASATTTATPTPTSPSLEPTSTSVPEVTTEPTMTPTDVPSETPTETETAIPATETPTPEPESEAPDPEQAVMTEMPEP